MINFARQGFANPFLSATGFSFQPGIAGCTGWHPTAIGLGQQVGGFAANPYGVPGVTGFGLINPLAAQFQTAGLPNINPLTVPLMNWQPSQFYNPGVGRGIDPRFGYGATEQAFGQSYPGMSPLGINPLVAGDPITSLLLQQQSNPLVNPLLQQQLPIRSLIGGQQGIGAQHPTLGVASPVTQWADPYRAFVEAQLISQLVSNPLYQLLQRGYGGVPEATGFGVPFGGQSINPIGQSINPFANVPFCG